MTSEPRAADPVDPDYLLQAFLILSERPEPANTGDPVMMTEADAERLLGRIANEVGTTPMMAFDLFRRCCAMANFFSVVSNRELINIDEAKPRPAIWAAAATVPRTSDHHRSDGVRHLRPAQFRDAVRRHGR